METNHTLEICKEFKSLIRPHPQKEFLELETSILNNGCLEPIKVWRGKVSTLWSSFFFSFMCFTNCLLYLGYTKFLG